MKRTALPLIVLFLVASACGGTTETADSTTAPVATTGQPSPTEYVSSDGRAIVEVDGDAPPITIEAVDDLGELGLPDDLDVYGAYELGPDGFDGGATVTVETGIEWGDQLPLVIGLLSTPSGEWQLLHSAAVGSVDGEMTVAFDVPHFSRLVIMRSDLAIDIDPADMYASVGERWDAYWDIMDPLLERIGNGPPTRMLLWDDYFEVPFRGTVRPILDEVDIEVEPRTSGSVGHVGGMDEIGTYDLWPIRGFSRGSIVPESATEIFYGYDTFSCLAPGAGFYGFTAVITVERPDLLLAVRHRGRIGFVRPTAGVDLRYDVAAPATCEENRHVPLSRLLQGYQGLSGGRTAGIIRRITMDTGVGGIYSKMIVMPGGFRPSVDLGYHTGFKYDEPLQLQFDLTYNFSVFECGETRASDHLNGIEITTVCAPDVTPIDAGEVIVVAAEYMDVLPGPGSEDYYTYAVVFDSDGDPANDWQYQGDFDWDFYQGADRWYQLEWDPTTQAWSLRVSDNLDAYGPSGVRAILFGDTIMWVIPASEFASEFPAYRVTSFVHDGTFTPEVSGGDVSGADPTEPPIPVTALDG